MQKETLGRWIKSLLIAAIIFILWTLYLVLRRGYLNLYIFNKTFGSTAAIIAGVTLLIGPLSRKFPRQFTDLMTIRRQLGLVAFGLALLHLFASVFFLPDHFTFSGLLKQWPSMGAGLIAVFIWVYLAYISQNEKIVAMGSSVWKKRQQMGAWIAFSAIYLHLVALKWAGWIKWVQGQVKASPELAHPQYPPASIFVFIVLTVVLIYRGWIKLIRSKSSVNSQ